MSRKLLKSTSLVGGMTFLSRILGFVRDMMFARFFGAGLVMDAFFVAFKIPNFMRRLFAEGAFAQAFVPVFSEHKTIGNEKDIKLLADHVAGTLGGILLLITIVGVLAAPLVIYLFAPGFSNDPEKYAISVDMLRLTFPYLLFISLTAFAGGILNTYSRFAVPAFTPVLLNVCLIVATVWAAPYFDEPGMALAWGVFIAGLAQLLFQVPFLAMLRLLPRPRWGWNNSEIKRILKLMLPALFGSSVAQINLLLDTIIASFLVTGSVSWLYYSDRLMEFPLGVFGIALATVVLPSLSSRHASKSATQFTDTLDWALRLVVLIGLPASTGLFLLAGPILTTLFQYGEFSDTDAMMATASLMPFAIGMFGFMLVKILAPGYFARQDTRTPVKAGIIAVIANMVLNLCLVVPWVLLDYPAPHAGLAISTSLAAFINAGLLYRGLRRQVYTPSAGWGRLWLQVIAGNLVLAAVLWWRVPALSVWLDWSATERASQLALLIGMGLVAYVLALLLVGVRPHDLHRNTE
ncbi:MAG TPA: murein biosynthesis integral membrane protein MurJ [Gammaproteobacteria bacterium]|nr:murein biosynthesis integral membrane protein MurJ [Gammaproteobacteria bacterium]